MKRLSGVNIEPISHDELFQTTGIRPRFINDFNTANSDDMKEVNRLLMTEYSGDTLSPIPKCHCGDLSGGDQLGVKCPECNTVVSHAAEQPIESILWMRPPEGIDVLIQPASWRFLTRFLNDKLAGFDALRYLTDPSYRPTERSKRDKKVEKFLKLGLPRGLNNFYRNFDSIVQTLLENRIYTPSNRSLMEAWLARFKHTLFAKQIPLPSPMVFVIERGDGGNTYADLSMTGCLDAIHSIASLSHRLVPPSDRVKNTHTVKAIAKMAEFYRTFYRENLGKKEGMYRKQINGTRMDFSARAVITSRTRPHNMNEIIPPWGLTIALLRLHLESKMLRLGLRPNEIRGELYSSIKKYNLRIDKLIQEIIDESEDGALHTIFQRNPSLIRGSGLKQLIPEVCKDPKVSTIQFSVLCAPYPNADQKTLVQKSFRNTLSI